MKRDYDNDDGDKSEWNSNKEVIKRMNRTIELLNIAKHEGNISMAIDYERDYYLDLCGNLSKEEDDEIWGEITELKRSNLPNSLTTGTILMRIDALDRKLRKLAKKHGLHLSDKEDLSGL